MYQNHDAQNREFAGVQWEPIICLIRHGRRLQVGGCSEMWRRCGVQLARTGRRTIPNPDTARPRGFRPCRLPVSNFSVNSTEATAFPVRGFN